MKSTACLNILLDGFWMDSYAVTNAEFARLIEAAGYVTFAAGRY